MVILVIQLILMNFSFHLRHGNENSVTLIRTRSSQNFLTFRQLYLVIGRFASERNLPDLINGSVKYFYFNYPLGCYQYIQDWDIPIFNESTIRAFSNDSVEKV